VRVVVTGGAGFIGGNLSRALATEPDLEVVALDDLSTGSRANLVDVEAALVEGSILDRDLLDEVVKGARSIVHLAAIPSVPRSITDPVGSHASNASGTLEVLEVARRARRAGVVVLCLRTHPRAAQARGAAV
jgi:UDP-glucose 4-epimerase